MAHHIDARARFSNQRPVQGLARNLHSDVTSCARAVCSGSLVSAARGRPGRYAGEFHWVHDLAVDPAGNLYAGEVDSGKRVQKFSREP